MLHILIVYTLLLLFLICKQFLFLCPQLAVKTKYIDTLIKLLLYLLTYFTKTAKADLFPVFPRLQPVVKVLETLPQFGFNGMSMIFYL